MNGRQRNATNAQIWGKKNDSNYDGNCTASHCLSRTYKISRRWIFVGLSVTCNILKSAFWCLRLEFNLFVLNIDVSQCTLYGVNNKCQLISTPVTCGQRFKFLYFSRYLQTFNSGAEGLGSTQFWIPVTLLARLSEFFHGFRLSAEYSFALWPLLGSYLLSIHCHPIWFHTAFAAEIASLYNLEFCWII